MTASPDNGSASDIHAWRWVMFAAMVGVYFAFGSLVTSIPPMVSLVRSALGVGRGAMGLILSTWAGLYIFTAPLAGRAVDRIGIPRAIALAGMSIALSGCTRAVAQGPVSLALGVAVLGVGGPLISAAAPKLCAQYFQDPGEQRLAVSLYNLGPGLGGIAALFLTNAVLLPVLGGWRQVLVGHGVLAVAVTTVWMIVATRAPQVDDPLGGHPPLFETWRLLFASSSVRYALTLGAMGMFIQHSLSNWLPDGLGILAEVSIGAASSTIAVAGLVGMALLPVVPRFATRFGRPAALTTLLSAMGGLLLVVAWGTPTMALAAAVAIGIRAVLVPLMIMSLMDSPEVTPDNMGAANGLWFSVAEIGALAGPIVVGSVADGSGGFPAALTLLALFTATAVALVLVWGRRTVAGEQTVSRAT